LFIGTNLVCQTKNGVIKKSRSKSITYNKKVITTDKNKKNVVSKNKNNYGARYWYLIDNKTNKIVDSLIIYDFVFDK
jgi:hypothetical protein